MPVHVRKDVPGFIGNRLQHALWREAIALVQNGVCDAADGRHRRQGELRSAPAGDRAAGECRPRRHGPDARHPRDHPARPRPDARAAALSQVAGGRRQLGFKTGRRVSHLDGRQKEQAALPRRLSRSPEEQWPGKSMYPAQWEENDPGGQETYMREGIIPSAQVRVSRRLRRPAALAVPAILRFTRAYAAEPVIKVGLVSPRPARSPALPRPTPTSSAKSTSSSPAASRTTASRSASRSSPRTASRPPPAPPKWPKS